ncbi:unnamed protein product [Rotaria magnacalcarata]|uniref:CCHC-type domain-containing protein n=2 Tax=Rotaria magnacalcarata TaxID=392030 RepID=A0A816ULT0_9BILA|nr:unnamed protein product [Rotaria magnacalcarata]
MTAAGSNPISGIILQQPVFMSEENSCRQGGINNILPAFNNDTLKEQQLVYYTATANSQPMNTSQPYVYVHQLPNNQSVNHLSLTRLIMHHETNQQQQQQPLFLSNNATSNIHPSMLHSSTYQQHTALATCHPSFNMTELPPPLMTNTAISSTPISTSIKRGHNDTSGISESNTQIRPQHPQISNMQANTSIAGSTPIKRLRGMNQPITLVTDISQQTTAAACRFATTRFPFSPFTVIFSQDVREKSVIDDLTKHAMCVIRLKNKAQQPIRAVKLEFKSAKARNDVLETGEITVSHLKYKVVEFFAQANVLICSNCFGIGHFRKNCPQKSEATCKTCGDKSANLKDHNCSGIPKCIHCGGAHLSNDTKCKIVQQYRATLTRNLLANGLPTSLVNAGRDSVQSNNIQCRTTTSGLSYANVVKSTFSNSNSEELIFRKLDSILTKVEEESSATRQSLIEFKQEIRSSYEATQQQVEVLEEKVKKMEKKFEDLFLRTCTIIQNICTTLLDPQSSQGQNWKSYWQEQIKSLVELRSSFTKSTND